MLIVFPVLNIFGRASNLFFVSFRVVVEGGFFLFLFCNSKLANFSQTWMLLSSSAVLPWGRALWLHNCKGPLSWRWSPRLFPSDCSCNCLRTQPGIRSQGPQASKCRQPTVPGIISQIYVGAQMVFTAGCCFYFCQPVAKELHDRFKPVYKKPHCHHICCSWAAVEIIKCLLSSKLSDLPPLGLQVWLPSLSY